MNYKNDKALEFEGFIYFSDFVELYIKKVVFLQCVSQALS